MYKYTDIMFEYINSQFYLSMSFLIRILFKSHSYTQSNPVFSKFINIIFIFFMINYLFILIYFTQALTKDPPVTSLHNLRVYGNTSIGYYYSNFYIGTPPQRQSLILDTGSGVFAMPCQQCLNCGSRHINPKFRVKESKSSKILTCDSGSKACKNCNDHNQQCKFSISYSEGSSLAGILIEDEVFVSYEIDQYYNRKNQQQRNQSYEQQILRERVKTNFGCTTYQTHLFLGQSADGIFGLAPIRQHNFLQQLASKHKQFTQQKYSFSLCFANNGGIFTIGGINTTLNINTAFIAKTTYNGNGGQYTIATKQILINHNKVELPNFQIGGQGLFIDSGATFTYFPRQNYKNTIRELDRVCLKINCKEGIGEQYKCYQVKIQNLSLEQAISFFPNITIEFNQGKVNWTPQEYFLIRNRTVGQVCIGLLPLNRFILGGTWMTDKNIFFNLQTKQIQVYEANCDDMRPPSMKFLYDTEKPPLSPQTVIIQQDYTWQIILFTIILFIILFVILIYCVSKSFSKEKEQKRISTQLEVRTIESNKTINDQLNIQEMYPARQSSLMQDQQQQN